MIRKLVWTGLIIRAGLLIYGLVMDRVMNLKYTDYDYKVFSDAAQLVLKGKSPYDRITYRYTPLLAYFVVPNFLLFYEFGKVLFVAVDVLCAWLILKILGKLGTSEKLKMYAVGMWMLHPIVMVVSSRGNADCLIVLFSLLSLYLILEKKYLLGALVFGFAVHFKIYPIIYAIPFFLFIENGKDPQAQSLLDWIRIKLCNWQRIKFAVVSATVFLGLLLLFYYLYGYKFLFETYLFHFVRKDHRHNMSFFFYLVYLFYDSPYASLVGLIPFVAQWFLVILIGFRMYKDLPACIFYQSLCFVIFNKVCTAQYFIWYMGLIPLILPNNDIFHYSKILFFGIQVLWCIIEPSILLPHYYLEFKGLNTLLPIWLSTGFFFVCNTAMFCVLLNWQKIQNSLHAIEFISIKKSHTEQFQRIKGIIL